MVHGHVFRSKKPTIRPRVVVVLRLGHAMALAYESGLYTIHNCLAVSPFHGFA